MAHPINLKYKNDRRSIGERHFNAPRSSLTGIHKLVSHFGSGYVKALFSTCLTDLQGFDEHIVTRRLGGEASLMAFWHCNILMMTGNFVGYDARVLISEHGDGEHIAQVCLRLGNGVVRGSTTRGGARSLIQLSRQLENGVDVVVTPDGPKGPARIAQAGVIYLAARTGCPIVPVGVASDSYHEVGSWDKFRVPYPGSKIVVRMGEPLFIPAEAKKNPESWQLKLAQEMDFQEAKALREMPLVDWKMPRGPWTNVYR